MMSFAALLLFSLVAFHCGGAPPRLFGRGVMLGRGQGDALLLPLSLLVNRSILLQESVV